MLCRSWKSKEINSSTSLPFTDPCSGAKFLSVCHSVFRRLAVVMMNPNPKYRELPCHHFKLRVLWLTIKLSQTYYLLLLLFVRLVSLLITFSYIPQEAVLLAAERPTLLRYNLSECSWRFFSPSLLFKKKSAAERLIFVFELRLWRVLIKSIKSVLKYWNVFPKLVPLPIRETEWIWIDDIEKKQVSNWSVNS